MSDPVLQSRSNRNPDFDEPDRTQLRSNNTNIESEQKAVTQASEVQPTIDNNEQALVSSISRKGIEKNIDEVSTPALRIGPNMKSMNAPVLEITQKTPSKASTEVKTVPAEAPEDLGEKDNSDLVMPKEPAKGLTRFFEYPELNRGSLFKRPERIDVLFMDTGRRMYNTKVDENTTVETTKLFNDA